MSTQQHTQRKRRKTRGKEHRTPLVLLLFLLYCHNQNIHNPNHPSFSPSPPATRARFLRPQPFNANSNNSRSSPVQPVDSISFILLHFMYCTHIRATRVFHSISMSIVCCCRWWYHRARRGLLVLEQPLQLPRVLVGGRQHQAHACPCCMYGWNVLVTPTHLHPSLQNTTPHTTHRARSSPPAPRGPGRGARPCARPRR